MNGAARWGDVSMPDTTESVYKALYFIGTLCAPPVAQSQSLCRS